MKFLGAISFIAQILKTRSPPLQRDTSSNECLDLVTFASAGTSRAVGTRTVRVAALRGLFAIAVSVARAAVTACSCLGIRIFACAVVVGTVVRGAQLRGASFSRHLLDNSMGGEY